MNKLATVFKAWFTYAAAITLVCGIAYITVQQSYRMSANDPQFQIAEDAANALSHGADPKSLTGNGTPVEISASLAPYLIIYDAAGNMTASGANLNGKALQIPKGVIAYINRNGKDAATWQPQTGVRQAMVGIRSTSKQGYIAISGRSLRKVEERIALLGQQVAFGWFMSLIVMALIVFLQSTTSRKAELV